MCGTCGCANDARITVAKPDAEKHPQHLHHDEEAIAPHASELHARQHGTVLTVEQKILATNDRLACQNREWFQRKNILALNFVSSPGSGKTTLLVRTINILKERIPFSVIEGDQETLNDAQRIRETGCPAIQINTGMGCHLEARAIATSCRELNPEPHSVIAIENVGNLVCPALFDLGEAAKVVILSIAEGEDKPLKYPYMFRASQVMLLTKIDLLPHIPFDVTACMNYARQVNPDLKIFPVSAVTGDGMRAWCDWIAATLERQPQAAELSVEAT